jgi:hypothetical protein
MTNSLVEAASPIDGLGWSVIPVILLISFFSRKRNALGQY